LASLGVQFEVKTVPVDESYPFDLPALEVPEFLAKKKVEAMAELAPQALIIGADTVVILENSILEKPENTQQAAEFLTRLSNKKHQVVTGIYVKYQDNIAHFKDITQVSFGPLTVGEIEYYVETYRPLDKAGAYGIQEWIGMIGVTGIEGSYFNVVGLPVHKLYRELKKFI
jgi:septum formation protein